MEALKWAPMLLLLSNHLHTGHLGASLGVVELTVALHYVFNAPDDKVRCPHRPALGFGGGFRHPERKEISCASTYEQCCLVNFC